jgi:RNA polymerase sigma-70 factor (ECF subfamily)
MRSSIDGTLIDAFATCAVYRLGEQCSQPGKNLALSTDDGRCRNPKLGTEKTLQIARGGASSRQMSVGSPLLEKRGRYDRGANSTKRGKNSGACHRRVIRSTYPHRHIGAIEPLRVDGGGACSMTIESSRATLIDFLLTGYDDLKRRLARRLGSADVAADALHDTFLRLSSCVEIGPVKSPRAYLLRVATRLATNRWKGEVCSLADFEHSFDIIDDAPNPERIVAARSEIEALRIGMMDIPRRRRDILIAAAVEEVPPSVLAERFGVTKRTIQTELKLAVSHCAKLLDRDLAMRMPARRGLPSPDTDGLSENATLPTRRRSAANAIPALRGATDIAL